MTAITRFHQSPGLRRRNILSPYVGFQLEKNQLLRVRVPQARRRKPEQNPIVLHANGNFSTFSFSGHCTGGQHVSLELTRDPVQQAALRDLVEAYNLDKPLKVSFPNSPGNASDLSRNDVLRIIFEISKPQIIRLARERGLDAEELMQEYFIRLPRALELYDSNQLLSPYLNTVIRNLCTDSLRRSKRREKPISQIEPDKAGYSFDQSVGRIEFSYVSTSSSGQNGDEQLLASDVMREVYNLGATQREILLAKIRGESNAKIAKTLGRSVSSVKVQLSRARDVLKSRMGF